MKKIIAANWKMNKDRAQSRAAAEELASGLAGRKAERTVMIFPPFLSIAEVSKALGGCADTVVGAQNFYPAESGAYTGEISLAMLADAGASWVLVGHSERRHILHESDVFLAQKTQFALSRNFGVVFCIGETLEERESGKLADVLTRQISQGLSAVFDMPAIFCRKSSLLPTSPSGPLARVRSPVTEKCLRRMPRSRRFLLRNPVIFPFCPFSMAAVSSPPMRRPCLPLPMWTDCWWVEPPLRPKVFLTLSMRKRYSSLRVLEGFACSL